MAKALYHISGMHCASCVSRVEKALAGVPGVTHAAVNLASGTAHVTFSDGPNSNALAKAVGALGYGVEAPEDAGSVQDEAAMFRQRALWAIALALPVLVLEMGAHLSPAWHHLIGRTIGLSASAWLQFALTTAVLFGPGAIFFRIGVPSLLRRAPEMNALVALGAGAAYLYSLFVLVAPDLLPQGSRVIYFESAAIIVAFILIGRWLEARAKGQAGQAIRALMDLSPDMAIVERDGVERECPSDEVVPGDILRARPGDRIAVDGEVVEGDVHIDESMITGEPVPVRKTPGDPVIAGTLNGTGSLRYRATAVGHDTYLAAMARLVEEAQAQKMPIQQILDRVTAVFVPIVIAIALVSALVWLAFGAGVASALVVAVSVLIIACPCAMGLATPASILVGTGRAAEAGVLFRRSDALQRLSEVQVVAFDKTGTLTEGRMSVADVLGDDPQRLMRLAASVEVASEHPIAQAIVTHATAQDTDIIKAQHFRAVPGLGAHAQIQGVDITVGSAKFLAQSGVQVPEEHEAVVGQTMVYVAEDKAYLGAITLSDQVKPSAHSAVEHLHATGNRVAMITGDTATSASQVAASLKIDQVFASVLPHEKSAKVAELRSHGAVAFVGDGINDAPALAAADVGIGIGTGTDIAIETADVILASGDPMGVVRAQAIARATLRNIRQNLAWAFGYNMLLIPVAAGVLYPMFGVLLSPALASGAMALSSVAVVTNALRLRRVSL